MVKKLVNSQEITYSEDWDRVLMTSLNFSITSFEKLWWGLR